MLCFSCGIINLSCLINIDIFIPIFRFREYLMKVIPETCRAHEIIYLRFYLKNVTNTDIFTRNITCFKYKNYHFLLISAMI
jgi:hypothetical protein